MSAVVSAIVEFFNNLISAFQDITLWFQDLALYVPKWVFSQICEYLVVLLQWVHSLLPSVSSFSLSFSPTVSYFLGPFRVGTGLSMIVGAYVIRFIIRRLPVVG